MSADRVILRPCLEKNKEKALTDFSSFFIKIIHCQSHKSPDKQTKN